MPPSLAKRWPHVPPEAATRAGERVGLPAEQILEAVDDRGIGRNGCGVPVVGLGLEAISEILVALHVEARSFVLNPLDDVCSTVEAQVPIAADCTLKLIRRAGSRGMQDSSVHRDAMKAQQRCKRAVARGRR